MYEMFSKKDIVQVVINGNCVKKDIVQVVINGNCVMRYSGYVLFTGHETIDLGQTKTRCSCRIVIFRS
jgi:hypothetical protein